MAPALPTFDLTGFAELHRDDHHAPAGVLGVPGFPYVGLALTLPEFTAYLRNYDFGRIPPDGVVLHHTAIPDASWARAPQSNATWDAGEAGLSADAIKAKRLRQLGNIKAYYNTTLGWPAGPHLYIDDRWIYLMSPMAEPGIHAKWANSWRDAQGQLHYPVAIEVVGDYSHAPWPAAVAALVGGAVVALQQRLRTFELRYLYPDAASTPGMVVVGGEQRCAHPERLRGGGISSHRNYNKPACPGDAMTEAVYMAAITRAAVAPCGTLGAAPPTLAPARITEDTLLLSAPRCTLQQLHIAFLGKPTGGYSVDDVHQTILPAYWDIARDGGIDPLLAVSQLIAECGLLQSFWSQRPRRNPAGIGIDGKVSPMPVPGFEFNTDPGRKRWEEGLSFKSWKDDSVIAHVGRLAAYALPLGAGTPAQQALIARALRYRDLPDEMRGSAPTLKALGKAHNPTGQGWASPGDDYGARIATIANSIIARS